MTEKCVVCNEVISLKDKTQYDGLCHICWESCPEFWDCLNILEIEKLPVDMSGDWNEIKKQYKKLIAVYHPDQFESNDKEKREHAEKRTKEINVAFEKLWDMFSVFEDVTLDASDHDKKGEEFWDAGNYDDSLKHHEKATELEPNNGGYWKSQGVVLRKLKKFDDALVCFEKSVELEPDIARTWMYMASILHDRFEFDKALVYVEKAIKLEPNNNEWKNAKNVITASMELRKMTDSVSKVTDNLSNITSLMEDADEKTRKSVQDILKPFLNQTGYASSDDFSEKEHDDNSNDASSDDFSEREYDDNYYDIMGLSKHASSEEIKNRFRELTLKFHPDKEPSSLSQRAMKQIIEAYEILKDPVKRKEYDNTIMHT